MFKTVSLSRLISYFFVAFFFMAGSDELSSLSQAAQVNSGPMVQSNNFFPKSVSQRLSPAQSDSLQIFFEKIGVKSDLPADTTASDVVKWLLNALGGLFTTIILFFLHKWFPKIFPSKRKKDYI